MAWNGHFRLNGFAAETAITLLPLGSRLSGHKPTYRERDRSRVVLLDTTLDRQF